MPTAKEVLKKVRPFFEKDTLFNRINRFKRGFYILVQDKAIVQLAKLARLYPEPERHLVRKHNSQVWLDIFEEYMEYERFDRIAQLVEDFSRVFIGKIESENNYSERVEVLVEIIARKYNEGAFRKRKPHTPTNLWVEPSVLEARKKLLEDLERDINGTLISSDAQG